MLTVYTHQITFAAVWLQFEEMVRSWALKFSTIHVTVGSVLDANRDGERDRDSDYTWWMDSMGGVAVPTHFYAVVVKCVHKGMELAKCNPDQLDALGLLFQHPTEVGVSQLSTLIELTKTPFSMFVLLCRIHLPHLSC